MTIAELDGAMDLEEFFAWQQYDAHRADKYAREEADAEAIEAGEPTSDMRDEARAEARARGLDVGEPLSMRDEAIAEARARGLHVGEP